MCSDISLLGMEARRVTTSFITASSLFSLDRSRRAGNGPLMENFWGLLNTTAPMFLYSSKQSSTFIRRRDSIIATAKSTILDHYPRNMAANYSTLCDPGKKTTQ